VEYFARILGKDESRLSIINSALIVLISCFYIYTVGSYFKINIYPLEHRVIYFTFFDIYIINRNLDHIIIISSLSLWLTLSLRTKAKFVVPIIYVAIIVAALLTEGPNLTAGILDISSLFSLPLVISFLTYNKFSSKKNMGIFTTSHKDLPVNYLALIGILAAIIGLVNPSASFFSLQPISTYIRNYAYDVFLLFSAYSPIMILLLISSLPFKLLIKEIMVGILKIKDGTLGSFPSDRGYTIKSSSKTIYLLLFMLLSIVVVLIPHHPAINRDNRQIGVDTDYYVNWLLPLIHSKNSQEFIHQAFVVQNHGDRPFTLIFLFLVVKIVKSNLFYTIEYLPVILAPSLVLAIYFLTHELTSNPTASILAAFLTAISFHTLIGLYAGFYANWFALIIGYLSFVFLIRFLKGTSKVNLIIYSILMIFLMFSHSLTWIILAVFTCVFLGVMLKLNRYYSKKGVILVLIIVLSSAIINIGRMTVTGSTNSLQRDVGEIAHKTAGPEQFTLRWSNLLRTEYSFVGGQFSNFLILVLGLYWLFRVNLYEPSTIFLIVFLSIGIIPFFFGNWIIQTRVFYDIPFQIPTALALSFISKQRNGFIVLLPICIWILAMSVRAVSNFA
jgi:hypothetical protein